MTVIPKECFNEKILKSDDTLVQRVFQILDGTSQNCSDCFKLESLNKDNSFLLKIQLNIKSGISLLIFHTLLEKSEISEFNDVFTYSSYFFKKKQV